MPTSYDLTGQTPECPAHVHIGIGPGNVKWNVYLKPCETLESLTERVRKAQERLRARLAEKTPKGSELDLIRVSKLTDNGLHLIVDQASLVEEFREDYEKAKIGRSYIEATRRLLDAVLWTMEQVTEDAAEMARCGPQVITEEQQDFAYQSAMRSGTIARKRLQLALEGKRQPEKIRLPKFPKR